MLFDTKHIIDIISEAVDTLRKTNVITSIVNLSGNLYIVDLQDTNVYDIDDYLTLTTDLGADFEFCQVYAINSDTQIVVNSLDDSDISLSTSIKANKPYFDYTNWKSESIELTLKDNSDLFKNQKYPLIYLLLNIKEDRSNPAFFSSIDTINLYLIKQTNNIETDKWRHETNMPILRSLYDNLLEALTKHKNILVDNNYLPHNYEEIFFLGKEDKNQNKLNDYLDCIHLQFNNIRIKKSNKC